ncbi:NERD domain-containing protein [Pararhizobium mangrovi]|uniref:NERD domain-containing protein n=1 Tax=Pararhizobium mangrovi TaxID=2590452 RepID=UPI0015E83F2B|nr:NERD domain-containing protein [Pararhizobium mangrovi]
MPAYRSSAEAEIREPVVARLREIIPGCRIIHEINASSFGNRIDVLVVGEDRIAAVEIKSERDKLDRLPDQVRAMKRVAHRTFAAVHEKFLKDAHGQAFPPKEARHATVWVYPRVGRVGHVDCGIDWHDRDKWLKRNLCLPSDAIWMLWRDELHEICRSMGVRSVAKMTMEEAIDCIRWHKNGAEITRLVCATLRARKCVEADPAIVEERADAESAAVASARASATDEGSSR